jgi:hypothetical protein
MDFYNFDLSALNKNETYFEEIELWHIIFLMVMILKY